MVRFFFTLAVFLIQVFILDQNSYARPDQYLQYSSLSLTEKKQIVLETMKLVVSLEAKYKFESIKKNPNPSKLKKYTFLLEKAQSFLIGSAHAASSYSPRFQNFSSLLSNPEKCIYGGWISQMRNGFCTHPSNLPARSSERSAYTGQGCLSPQEISCNPLIFGHKKKDQNSLFCVPAGPTGDKAHNSSLRCMQKALSEEGDGKEKRLEELALEIQSNPTQAQALFEFVSKACICEAELPGLNERYHQYMRPHRTCFGLMKMLASSANECSTPPVLGDNHALIQSLGTMIIPAYEDGSESQVDEYYISFLSDLKKSQEFKNFCSGDNFTDSDETNDGSTSGDSQGGATSGSTSGATSGSTSGATSGSTSGATSGSTSGATSGSTSGATSGSTTGETSGATSGAEGGQGLQNADPDEVNPGATSGTDGGTLLVSDTPPVGGNTTGGTTSGGTTPLQPVGPDGTSGGSGGPILGNPTPEDNDSNSGTPSDEGTNSPLSITVSKISEDDGGAQVEAKTNPESLPDGVSIVWFAKGEKLPEADPESADPDVIANQTPAQAPIDLTNINLGTDNPTAEGEKRYPLSNRMIYVTKIPETYQICAKLIKGEVIVASESCVEINGDDANDDVPVDDESDEDDEDTDFTYTLVLTPSGNQTITLKVTITPDPADGAKLHWFKRTPKEKSKPLPGSASSDDDPVDEVERISLEKTKSDEIKDTEDKRDIDVNREETDKEVCAVIFEDGKQASNVACSKIEKVSETEKEKDRKKPSAPLGPYMPTGPQGPPMIPLRGGGDVMIRGVY